MTIGRNCAVTHASFVLNLHSILIIADGSEVGYDMIYRVIQEESALLWEMIV
jgi:hypothetical protein